jgi:hypothetical protein
MNLHMDKAMHRTINLNFSEHLPDLLGSKLLRHGVATVFALVALALIWSMIPRPVKASATTASAVAPVPRPDAVAMAGRIAEAHLFGLSPAEAEAGPAVARPANISVRGLLYTPDPDTALAILEVDGKSGFFRTGDVLPDGEKLTAIGISAVQISNGLSKRVVEFEKQSGPGNSGILLAGMPRDDAANDPFPGLPGSVSPGGAMAPRLQPVSIPQNASPLEQMRALRQQLIKH